METSPDPHPPFRTVWLAFTRLRDRAQNAGALRKIGWQDRRVSLAAWLLVGLGLAFCQFHAWKSKSSTRNEGVPQVRGFAESGKGALPPSPQRHNTSRYYDPVLASVADGLDARTRYAVATALEDCYLLANTGTARLREDFIARLTLGDAANAMDQAVRLDAFDKSTARCVAFDGAHIAPDKILGLLQSAAKDGDERALARTLLFRDLADSKMGSFDLVTRLLASGDPYVIRDVGLFLTRGEDSVLLGNEGKSADAATLAIAWELVACDFGLECGADSKLLMNLCAYQGQCGAASYDAWLSRYSASQREYREIQRLRLLLRDGLIASDWQFLGLAVLKPPA